MDRHVIVQEDARVTTPTNTLLPPNATSRAPVLASTHSNTLLEHFSSTRPRPAQGQPHAPRRVQRPNPAVVVPRSSTARARLVSRAVHIAQLSAMMTCSSSASSARRIESSLVLPRDLVQHWTRTRQPAFQGQTLLPVYTAVVNACLLALGNVSLPTTPNFKSAAFAVPPARPRSARVVSDT
ncbi:hypothetical protein EXIGLDRAFT_476858 [Exidia glandulosa HHB12029]|uniref:Uncharacterized protein n=1 Tax=Exidia glandulosa HHB12029 TaxID=1314781 RepID=A0A165JVJ6_EXIGL|nr:hypothetical protein EXIGLDRAFT_476858 [Exidia glandulosa HHB12029]